MSQRLVVIDGKSVFYRGYYAMPGLSTRSGTATGGVYGFAVLALEILKRFKPDYICVAWDKSKTNIRSRKRLYPKYKAGRKKPPQDFYDQIPLLQELLDALGWPLYEADDYEADDIMATLARVADKQNLETILISSDLDLLQVISPKTTMYALKKGLSNIQKFDIPKFETEYGIKLEQFIDFKALMGDSSDNIPGILGIGRKGAASLLNEFGSLDGIYQNLDKIKDNVRQKLIDKKPDAFLSKKLVTLMFDAPIGLDLESMKSFDNMKTTELQQVLEKLEFNSLVQRLSSIAGISFDSLPTAATKSNLPSLTIKQHGSLHDIAKLDWSEPIFIDLYCLGHMAANPVYVVATDSADELHVYDVKDFVQLNIKTAKIYGYDTKRAVQFLIKCGVDEITIDHDVHVAAFLLDSLSDHTLTGLAKKELGYGDQLDNLSPEDYKLKVADIGAVIIELCKRQKARLKKLKKLNQLVLEIEWPVIPIIAKIELAGMAVDKKVLDNLRTRLEDDISDLEQIIYGHADQSFNIASPAQLSRVLYEDLQLPTQGIKKGRTGYSTAANQLAKLKDLHPIISHIIDYREHAKLKSTYVDALPDYIAEDGRVHSRLNLTATSTGRLSSSEPNLQNIPVRTELGRKVRQAFTVGKGNTLISLDYSQFELRLAAILSKDEAMIEAFNSDIDIHSLTASQVFQVPIEKVTKDMRYSAKTVNFGILYGQGSHGLAEQTGMTYAEARKFIDAYFEQRQALSNYIKHIRTMAKDQGYVETLFGRRRPTPDVLSANFIVREGAYRQAVNMPIQGTEADLMKIAMIKLDKALDEDCQQIMQVHDSILIECPIVRTKEISALAKGIMENVSPNLGIKLRVEVTSGQRWDQV